MINFDSLTLKALVKEIEPILVNGRIYKVQQPYKNTVLLSIRANGKNYKLYFCTDPKYPHVCLLTEESEQYRSFEMPKKPPMFCMLLRKHMEGARIKLINQPENERIFEIYFESYDDLGARVPLVLACELMGKYSNIILYNYDTNVILGCAHNVSSEKSRQREIAGGLPYIYPPKQNKADLLQISESRFLDIIKVIPNPVDVWLNQNFNYISLALAGELCRVTGVNIDKDKIIATSYENIKALYNSAVQALELNNINPALSSDKKIFSLIGQDPEINWDKTNSVNTMIDLYFGYQAYLDVFSKLKSELASIIRKELKKYKEKLSQYEKNLDSGEKAETYRQYADILMANLYKITQKQENITLENFFENNQLVIIQLDPSKNPADNAQKYYKLYNKAKNAFKISKDLITQVQNEINYLESIELSIDQALVLSDLKQIKQELISQNIIKKAVQEKGKQKKESFDLTEYTSSDNYKIYIGKNNRQNDYLVSKLSSPEDIWLHSQNIPGGHVLIKVPSDNLDIPDTTLSEAANIAAYFSQARNSSSVSIIYTKRKFLKKPPCCKPGYVTYSHEKTILASPERCPDFCKA